MNSLSKVIKLKKSVNNLTPVNDKILNYLKDESLKKIIDETVERAKNKAFQEGYQKGLREASAAEQKKFSNASLLISNSIKAIDSYIGNLYVELEADIIQLIVYVSEIVVRNQLKHGDEISQIIKDSIHKITEKRGLYIKLHPHAGKYFEQVVAELRAQNIDLSQVKIDIDPQVGEGGCYIETNRIVIDARIDKILSEIRTKIEELVQWQLPPVQQ